MPKQNIPRTRLARDKIRQWILSLREVDHFISENELMRTLELSRTPVREALAELQGEGLVEIIPKKGTRIKKPSGRDVRAILDLRKVIEAFVAIQLANRQPPGDPGRRIVQERLSAIADRMNAIARKRTAVTERDNQRFWELDMEYHTAVCSLAGYEPGTEVLRRFQHQLRLVAVSALHGRQEQIDVVAEHNRITESILSRRPDDQEIRSAVHEHLDNAGRRWFL